VSFRAEPGAIFGLLGPNGAGKTSTLECVLGLRHPDAGQITLGDIDLIRDSTVAKALIGAALQSAQLQDKVTPREALRLFSAFYPHARTPDAMLEEFQLTEKADTAFASLSGGQKQRLFLALAFIHNPKLVVLDEPTVGLDPTARRELHVAIRRARAAGCAIVLSTHDLAEAEQLCDRVAIIDHGRIVASNTVPQLIASSRARVRVCVRARTRDGVAVSEVGWEQIEAAANVSTRGDEIIIATDHVNRTTIAVIQRLQERGEELLDLRVQRPSLEDVFFEVTGRVYSESGDASKDITAEGTAKVA
jgi:ABC-2 type transport system ATP-binding protein